MDFITRREAAVGSSVIRRRCSSSVRSQLTSTKLYLCRLYCARMHLWADGTAATQLLRRKVWTLSSVTGMGVGSGPACAVPAHATRASAVTVRTDRERLERAIRPTLHCEQPIGVNPPTPHRQSSSVPEAAGDWDPLFRRGGRLAHTVIGQRTVDLGGKVRNGSESFLV